MWVIAIAIVLVTRVAAAQVTHLGVLPEPALPPLPAAGGTLVDPTFGTTILRVTDATTYDGKSCGTAYSYWPTFNRTSTRLWALCGTNGVLFDFAPATLALSNRRPLFASPPPGGYAVAEDTIWSGIDPDVLFTHDATRLWAYDVTTGVFTLVKDLTALQPGLLLHQMSRSVDDDVFAFTTKKATNGAVTGYVVYRRSTDSYPVHVATTQLDEVQIDKSGRYLLVKTGLSANPGTVIRNRVIDVVTGAVEELTDGTPDFAVGHSDSGVGTVVGYDRWNNQLTGRQLATPHTLFTVQPFGDNWQGLHLSLLADDERWATVSHFRVRPPGGSPEWAPFHQEIYQVATDGSGRVRRLAHHRSVYSSYWDAPRGNVSRDSRFIAFTSNWGGSSRQDLFVLIAPVTGMCGDGTLDTGEACDDGDTVDGDGCDSNCTPTACGNRIVSAGEECDDGNLTGGDCCSPTCSFEPAGASCDDADLCTGSDRCDEAGSCAGAAEPAAACRTTPFGGLALRGGNSPNVSWKWSRGTTTLAELGNPTSGGTSYALCVYDEVAAGSSVLRLRARLPAGGTCAGKPCWTLKSSALSYKNRGSSPDGLTTARLKTGADSASLSVKGRGQYLAVSGLPFAQRSRVTVQLRNSEGACWTTELPAPADRSSATQFKDRLR
jgi:cysteine-rich repeat protein